jgi:hypothetical protein
MNSAPDAKVWPPIEISCLMSKNLCQCSTILAYMFPNRRRLLPELHGCSDNAHFGIGAI